MKRGIWLALALLMACGTLWAASKEVFIFEKDPAGGGLTESFQAWHNQFKDDKDYGESWFFLSQLDDGGTLFAMVSITNLGLRTFDGSYEVHYYPAKGEPVLFHKEVKFEEITASTEKMDVKVGGAHAWGGGDAYHFTLDEPGLKVRMDVQNSIPRYKLGNGKVQFFEDRSAEWTLGFNTPRGRSFGTLTANGASYSLAGNVYADHGWATIKIPDIIKKWYALRIYDPAFTVVLHHQYLTKRFGYGDVKVGILGTDKNILAVARNFALTPTAFRKEKSGYQVPTDMTLKFEAGGYKVAGTIKEERYLGSIDVLGQVSWPVRIVIKAFYSNPFMHRYIARYELDVTDKDGLTKHISGSCVMEANYF